MDFHCNVSYEELTDLDLIIIEQRMSPGKYSQCGFLQENENLDTVYQNDKTFLEFKNITYKQIVDRLETIIAKYHQTILLDIDDDIDDDKIKIYIVEGKYEVSSITYNGAQRCPFQDDDKDPDYHGYEYGSTDITITDINTKQTITFNTLLLHMIGCHHFFEGPLCSHRLCPEKVIEMFDLQPNINYEPNYKYYNSWVNESSCSHTNLTKADIDILATISFKRYDLTDNIIALLFPKFHFNVDKQTIASILKQGSNFSWEVLLNDCDFYDYSDDEDEFKNDLKEINTHSTKYKTTGKLKYTQLLLYRFECVNDKTSDEFVVEGTKLSTECDSEACYHYEKIRYVSIDD